MLLHCSEMASCFATLGNHQAQTGMHYETKLCHFTAQRYRPLALILKERTNAMMLDHTQPRKEVGGKLQNMSPHFRIQQDCAQRSDGRKRRNCEHWAIRILGNYALHPLWPDLPKIRGE
mmetsp:Transcript_7244/g.11818  ORF Transcript_7244/g.11818 Transcript_7244/m.11818 type:complete len:119 (+) Transcript_7244:54-410(+)